MVSDQLHLSDCIWHGKLQRRSVLLLTGSPSPLSVVLLGKYGLMRVTNGPFDQTFSSDLLMEANTAHCLTFYYFLMEAVANDKIEVGWRSDTETQVLGEVVPNLVPKWEQRRIEFTSSSTEYYKVRFGVQGLCRHAIFRSSGSDLLVVLPRSRFSTMLWTKSRCSKDHAVSCF